MLRPNHLPPLLSAKPPSSVLILSGRRYRSISIHPPKVCPGKPEPRIFSERKTYLYNHINALLNRASSSSQPILFLHHNNFKANGMIKLRREVVAAALQSKGVASRQGTSKFVSFSLLEVPPDEDALPKIEIIRTSIFGVALRDYAPLDREAIERIAKMASGGALAVITLPSLDPPVLQGVLRALDRVVPPKKKSADDASQKQQQQKKKKNGRDDEDENFVPGRRLKRQKPMLDPELSLAGALIEGRMFSVDQVKEVSKLPTLETLRQQIVGLISSPAVQLALVLGEASGGRLARTLEGLKKGLEEGEGKTEKAGEQTASAS